MGITPFNELFTDYENLHTRAEIEEEVEQLQDEMIDVPDPIEEIQNKEYRMPLWMARAVASHNYTKGYIDALKWVLKGE